jgi:phage RecT family recombinase
MGTELTVFNQAFQDRALPSRFNGNRFDKEMRWAAEKHFAQQVAIANPQLLECSPESIQTSMLEVAWSGMTLAPSLGHGYLIPYWNDTLKVRECTFKPGYRGLAYMAMKGGAVMDIPCARVLQADKFRVYTENNRQVIDHEENWQVSNRGPLIAVWSVAKLASGGEQVEITPAHVILAAEAASMAKNPRGGKAWKGAFRDQMERKVSIRRVLKLVPPDPSGWLRHGLEVVDKHDAIDFDKVPPAAHGSQELLVSEDQVLQLHALLTDRGFTAARAENWLTNAANAFNCRTIRDLPARHFEEAKTRLAARANKAGGRS